MLKKCKKYPNCECFVELVHPVEHLGNVEEAEFFAGALKEIQDYCADTHPIHFEGIRDFIIPYLKDLPVSMRTVFTDILLEKLRFHYSWKMPKTTLLYQLKKFLMENGFKPTSLSDLEKDNDEFDRQVALYEQKQRTATRYIELEEFIEAELKRVEGEFIKPLTILRSNAPVRTIFNHSTYCGFAFKQLSEGHDWSLLQVKEHALGEYKMMNNETPSDLEEFNKGVIGNCKRGVALLMYCRFLKEKQKKSHLENIKVVDSVGELEDFFRQNESRQLNQLVKGLKTLQDYVIKNVFQDTTRDLLKLERLERDLTTWKFQLETLFINNADVNRPGFILDDIENRKTESIQNMLKTINDGLHIIELRKKGNAGTSQHPKEGFISESSDDLTTMTGEHLSFMNNRNPKNNQPVASFKQYDQLTKLTIHFMRTGKLPDKYDPVARLNIDNESLKYTFRQLYKANHPDGKLPFAFFSFLSNTFAQLTVKGLNENNYMDYSLYKKGSSKPTHYDQLKKGK